jgi:hypothetical protein
MASVYINGICTVAIRPLLATAFLKQEKNWNKNRTLLQAYKVPNKRVANRDGIFLYKKYRFRF